MNTATSHPWKKNRDERGAVLMMVVLFLVVLLIGVGAFYGFAFSNYNAVLRNEWMTQAIFAAEAGVDRKLAELTQRNTANISGTLNFDAGGVHQGTYDVFYGVVTVDPVSGGRAAVNPLTGAQIAVSDFGNGDEVIIVTGTVRLNNIERARQTLRVGVRQTPLVNPRAAVTIRGIAATTGAVTLDGREHNSGGQLTGEPGTYGLSTVSNTFSQGGSSKVGGNGIAPASPANPTTYELNGPAVPDSPEKVLGLSDGALDAFKTDTPPTAPFNGVVFLTSSWEGVNIDGSSGIFICHNKMGSAFLKNIHGTFKGLIITDDLIHINGDAVLIGAVYGLKTNGVTLGNGSAEIKFSSEVLSSLPLVGYSVTSWQDEKND